MLNRQAAAGDDTLGLPIPPHKDNLMLELTDRMTAGGLLNNRLLLAIGT